MTRLLFAALLCTLGAAQASAQNGVSQRLLELDDGERNGAFTLMLRDSNRTCDQVIRTLFNGTVLGVDEWEALCRDRNSYSISVLAEQNDTIITSLSCRELLATSKLLLHRAGSKSKAAGCRISGRMQDQRPDAGSKERNTPYIERRSSSRTRQGHSAGLIVVNERSP